MDDALLAPGLHGWQPLGPRLLVARVWRCGTLTGMPMRAAAPGLASLYCMGCFCFGCSSMLGALGGPKDAAAARARAWGSGTAPVAPSSPSLTLSVRPSACLFFCLSVSLSSLSLCLLCRSVPLSLCLAFAPVAPYLFNRPTGDPFRSSASAAACMPLAQHSCRGVSW